MKPSKAGKEVSYARLDIAGQFKEGASAQYWGYIRGYIEGYLGVILGVI